MSLDRNTHQGWYAERYVSALAAAAGLTVAKSEPDVTGDDYTIAFKGLLGGMKHPKIDVQVKSWSESQKHNADGCWQYPMKAAHFNNLAGSNYSLPRYLILVVVPNDWTDYALATPHELRLRYAAYWASLQDREEVDVAVRKTVRVPVPVANLLTMHTLRALLDPGSPIRARG